MAQVNVYINRTQRLGRWFEGYEPGDPLELALSFTTLTPLSGRGSLLEYVFAQLNTDAPQGIGSLTREQIHKYHQRYPSLSVGDVVEIDEAWYKVAKLGFEYMEAPSADTRRLPDKSQEVK